MNPGWPRRIALAAAALAVIGAVASCVVPLIPIWPCDLFEHFRVQYFVVGAIVAASAGGLRMGVWCDAAVFATLIHGLWLAPDLCASARTSDGDHVRVLVLNVHTEASSFAEVRALIDDLHPDVIGLVEMDERWIAGVAPAVASYRGRLERPRPDNFGVALYTREPLVGSIEELGGLLPSAVAEVTVGTARFNAILIHPFPPMSAAALAAQRDELDAVADRARALPGPVIVLGDFNATPWSRPFRRLLDRSGLCDSRAGFGIQSSFPAAVAWLRIPIDHLLATCSIGIADRHVERDVGSDHLPVSVELVVPRR
jgi:endonuclease/exonuclease/phosphatase (EEP) superfamily protein YafD